jgi:hypothetical protein
MKQDFVVVQAAFHDQHVVDLDIELRFHLVSDPLHLDFLNLADVELRDQIVWVVRVPRQHVWYVMVYLLVGLVQE